MRTAWYRSLSFKLFLATAALVAAIAAAISVQNGRLFRIILERQAEEAMVSEAQRTASSFQSLLRYLRTLAQSSLSAATRLPVGERDHVLDALLFADPDLLGFGIVSADGKLDVFRKAAGLVDGKSLEKFVTESRRAESLSLARIPLGKGVIAISVPVRGNPVGFVATAFVRPEVFDEIFSVDGGAHVGLIGVEGTLLLGSLATKSVQRIDDKSSYSLQQVRDTNGMPHMRIVHAVPGTPLALAMERPTTGEAEFVAMQVRRVLLFGWILFVIAAGAGFLVSRSLTRRIESVIEATVRIAAGQFETPLPLDGKDEVGRLSAAVRHMSQELRRFVALQVDAARREGELRTAREVQARFLPPHELRLGSARIQADFRSATECAGDWWGVFPLSHTHGLVAVGDITGHGASSALVVASVFTWFSMLCERQGDRLVDTDPSIILSDLNDFLWQTGKGRTTLTLFLGIIEFSSGSMRYSNAGHLPPLHFHLDENGEVRVSSLALAGSVLGSSDEASFFSKETALLPGDQVVIYTDGLVECRNAKGKTISRRELRKFLEREFTRDPAGLGASLIRATGGFFADTELDDDVTSVVLTFEPPSKRGA